MMLFNSTKLVFLGGLLISCLFVTGQTFKRCGAFINVDGDIITNAYVIGDKTRSIIVEDFVGKRYPATIKKIARTIDLAVISVNQKTRNFAFLRMDDNNDFALTPVLEEAVNVIGYPQGSFDPRGALVTDINPTMLRTGYFRVGIGSAYNCSGAPILDDMGMLIGFIANGTKEKERANYEGYTAPHIFGFDATIFLPFISGANLSIGKSNQKDPFKLVSYDTMDNINRIVDIGATFTVRVYCSE